MKQLVFCFLLSIAFLACKKRRDEPAPTQGIVEGTVKTLVDSTKSIPIKNVEVYYSYGSKLTDNKGKFYLKNMKKGKHFFTFSHNWYEPRFHLQYNITAGETNNIEILLTPNTPILHAESDDFDSTNALNFGDEAVNLNFNLINIGTEGELNWEIDVSNLPAWVSINQTEEDGITTIEVVINRVLLAHQSANDTIFIQNTDNPEMTVEVPIVVNTSSTELIENTKINGFITKWTVGDVKTVHLPLYESTVEDPTEYSFIVDWGDGTIGEVTAYDDPDVMHTYVDEGEKIITINGLSLKGFNFSKDPTSKDLFVSVEQWGNVALGNGGSYFLNCSNLSTFGATDAPDLSETTTLFRCFENTNFNGDLSAWDVNTITNMDSLFNNCALFNADLSSWDVSNVTTMAGIFNQAEIFDQNISSWDVGNVTDMNWMFSDASAFNQDISSWDVSNVTDMNWMFYQASAFNQDISSWDVTKVTNMNFMFYQASAFNQDISSWDVNNVTSMSSMFRGALTFNQDISNWNVSNITSMSSMFYQASAFNQDISSWNVSNVTSMNFMFYQASAFNQNISSWDVSEVKYMYAMFYDASAFSQNISSWNTINVTSCTNFSTGSAMTTEQLPTLGTCF